MKYLNHLVAKAKPSHPNCNLDFACGASQNIRATSHYNFPFKAIGKQTTSSEANGHSHCKQMNWQPDLPELLSDAAAVAAVVRRPPGHHAAIGPQCREGVLSRPNVLYVHKLLLSQTRLSGLPLGISVTQLPKLQTFDLGINQQWNSTIKKDAQKSFPQA